MIRRINIQSLYRMVAACLLLCADHCVPAQEQKAVSNYTVERGVAFAHGKNGDLLADLYKPDPPGLRPAIVYLHGGAWKSGDRSQLKKIAAALAADGYLGMAIDYDLSSQGVRFPTPLEESKEAIRWLRAHASLYHVDPQHVVAAGSSAGGELAALVALTEGDSRYDKGANLGQSSDVSAVIIFNGVLDLSYVGSKADADMVKLYLGATCAEAASACRNASPVNQVHRTAPPFFVGHGTSDEIVPYSQAVTMVESLRKDGVTVTPFIAEAAGHTYWAKPEFYEANLQAVRNFLSQVLQRKTK